MLPSNKKSTWIYFKIFECILKVVLDYYALKKQNYDASFKQIYGSECTLCPNGYLFGDSICTKQLFPIWVVLAITAKKKYLNLPQDAS